MHPVPPIFFLEVKRNRTIPFWKHELLVPLDGTKTPDAGTHVSTSATPEGNSDLDQKEDPDSENDEDSDDEIIDTEERLIGGKTFGERMTEHIDMLRDFANGLEYQVQFNDNRMLDRLEREGGSFLRFAQNCLNRERRMNSTRGTSPMTWEKATASAMFYRTRPPAAERGT